MFKYLSFKVSVWRVILLVGDVCVLFLSLMIAFFLNPKIGSESWKYLNAFKFRYIPMGLVYLLVNYIADLYDYQQDYRRWWNIAHVFIAGLIGALGNKRGRYLPARRLPLL